MMTDAHEILSALIDREPVDPDLLAQILEDRSNRALLVDFVRVRAALQADEAREPVWRGPSAVALTRMQRSPRAWPGATAAFLLIAAGAGGGTWIERQITRERPPEPERCTVRALFSRCRRILTMTPLLVLLPMAAPETGLRQSDDRLDRQAQLEIRAIPFQVPSFQKAAGASWIWNPGDTTSELSTWIAADV